MIDALKAVGQAKAKRKPSDVQRILALPVRDIDKPVPDLTARFARPSGTMTLRPIQSEILLQAYINQGLLGLVGVGEGKTLATFLLPWTMKARRPLLLIPAAMREQCMHDWKNYNEHFILPDKLMLHSYEELSNNTSLLRDIAPDLIICDEAHKLRNMTASRTRRMSRYMSRSRPKFVALSGTLTSTSIMDFVHLARWALNDNAPVPISLTYLRSWAEVLDRDGKPSKGDKLSIQPLISRFGNKDPDARNAFKRRLVTTPGIVTSKNAGPPCNLIIHTRLVKTPDGIANAMADVQEYWRTPAGDELSSPLEFSRVTRQLACGFFYVWKWPNDQPDEPWLEARAAWNKAVRRYLAREPGEGYDSPGLLDRACVRLLQGQSEQLPRFLVEAYKNWIPQKAKKPPPTAARWISNFLLDDVISWVSKQKEPPIIWYGHKALAYRLHKMTGWPVFGDGPEASRALLSVTKPCPAILSINAHSQGKNLQLWGNQIVSHPLSDGARSEQLLGRCHRTGQLRDEVHATYFGHDDAKVFEHAMLTAKRSAKYIEQTTDQPQRLIYADWTDPSHAGWKIEQSEEAEKAEKARILKSMSEGNSSLDDSAQEG